MSSVQRQRDVTILHLGSSYSSLEPKVLEEFGEVLFSEAIYADPPFLVLDLSQTRFIGSSFVELLVRAWKRLRQREGSLAVCGLQPFCSEVFRATNLDKVWPCYPTQKEAVDALNSSIAGSTEARTS